MITGFDTVVVAAAPAAPGVAAFLSRWAERWPLMRVAVEGTAGSDFVAWRDRPTPLPAEQAEILVARDDDMVADWDRDGYHLDAHDEGPFQIMYRPCPLSQIRAMALEDPYGRSGFAFEPYEFTLAGSNLSLVTIVTPDEDGAFSATVIDELVELLGDAE